jgi:outer membrane protein assembly complex protein YaeT
MLSLAFLVLAFGFQEPSSLEIVFEGRKAFPETELRMAVDRDLERYRREPRPAALDDAVFRLTQHYRSRGYHFVSVTAERRERQLVFTIIEGNLVKLGSLRFQGNTAFSRRELRDLLEGTASGRRLLYSKKLLALHVETILVAYGAKGYIEAAVASPAQIYNAAEEKMDITYRITEGRPFVIAAVGPAPPGFESRFAEMVGLPFDPTAPAELEAAILDHLREQGYPHPFVVATPKIDRETCKVGIDLDVRPGKGGKVGTIEVTGNELTRTSFILSRSALVPGRPYRASEAREGEKRLLRTGLFRQVRITPGEIQEGTDQFPVTIFVEEIKPGEVSVRAGTGSLDGPRVGADVAYVNLFGGGELVRLGGTVSRTGGRANFEVAFPWFLGTDFRPGLSLYYEEQELPSFDVVSYGFVPSVLYPFTDKHSVTLGARYAAIRTDNVDPGVPAGDLLDFEYNALFLATSLDFRDSALLPTKGVRVTGSVEWAPASFATDIEFMKASGRGDFYVPLPADLVFAVSVQGGVIRPLAGTEEIPISLRFFAGGTNTVRGFKYGTIGESIDGEPTGGDAFFAVQAELRFRIWQEFHGALFTDRGGVWLDTKDAAFDDTRWSAGAGLRYYTPAGALALDVAWNPSREEGEEPVVFHISIGFPF